MKLYGIAIALLILLGSGTASWAERVEGKATVIDADTLQIGDRQVRLAGIDAPEAGQEHKLATGGTDYFGRAAALKLHALVTEDIIRCDVASLAGNRGLTLATCFNGTVDLGADMLASGMAMTIKSSPPAYAEQEAQAKKQRKGFWHDDTIEPPWRFRERRVREAEPASPNGCVFKARMDASDGRVLIAPWSPWYGRVQVDEKNGDRWFCSEAEAIAQGWLEPQWLMRAIEWGTYTPR